MTPSQKAAEHKTKLKTINLETTLRLLVLRVPFRLQRYLSNTEAKYLLLTTRNASGLKIVAMDKRSVPLGSSA